MDHERETYYRIAFFALGLAILSSLINISRALDRIAGEITRFASHQRKIDLERDYPR